MMKAEENMKNKYPENVDAATLRSPHIHSPITAIRTEL